jgi:hypothetical protein
MPIKLSPIILLDSDALPSRVGGRDGCGVIIEGENDKKVNPFFCEPELWDLELEEFGLVGRWKIPENERDERFTPFLHQPNIPRPELLTDFLSYGRSLRNQFKKKANWRKRQAIIKFIVWQFFERSKARKTKVTVFRASIVLGLFLICHRKSKSMTNMLLHLAHSCVPPAPLARPARMTTPDPMSRPCTMGDLHKALSVVIENQGTLLTMLLNVIEITKPSQSRKRTRASAGSYEPDQDKEKKFGILHLSDVFASARKVMDEVEDEVEDGVEDEVEDEIEDEGGEELEAYEDEVHNEEHDEAGDQDDDDDEAGDQVDDDDEDEGHSEDEEYSRGGKRQRSM